MHHTALARSPRRQAPLRAPPGCSWPLATKTKCLGIGWTVHTTIADYISDKCNGAQNK